VVTNPADDRCLPEDHPVQHQFVPLLLNGPTGWQGTPNPVGRAGASLGRMCHWIHGPIGSFRSWDAVSWGFGTPDLGEVEMFERTDRGVRDAWCAQFQRSSDRAAVKPPEVGIVTASAELRAHGFDVGRE
jgi:hypothetical protein